VVKKPKKLPLATFRNIYSKVPRLCVDLVVKNKGGVLLTFRNIPPSGKWHLPGGTVLFGESQRQTAKRVAKEELGVKLVGMKLLGVINFDPERYKEGVGHALSVCYLASVKGEVKLDRQALRYDYFKKAPRNFFVEQRRFLIEKGLIMG
jgi:ADP-ribose pyrophosphatase YjhB (NUDIX family)